MIDPNMITDLERAFDQPQTELAYQIRISAEARDLLRKAAALAFAQNLIASPSVSDYLRAASLEMTKKLLETEQV